MPKITFMGAGSTVFAKNVLGDCLHDAGACRSPISPCTTSIPAGSRTRGAMLENINRNAGGDGAHRRPSGRRAPQGARAAPTTSSTPSRSAATSPAR